MSTNKFTFFESLYDAMCDLRPQDQLELFKAICEYAFYDNENVKLSREANMLFKTVKPSIKKSAGLKNSARAIGVRPKKETIE